LSALVYPEWDYKRNAYRQDYFRVLTVVTSAAGKDWKPDDDLRRRIRRVRRHFEAVRPRLGAAAMRLPATPLVFLKPNLNTTFRELVDLKKELAKFMPAWHYALGGRGAF
jgi:hypothetical protein